MAGCIIPTSLSTFLDNVSVLGFRRGIRWVVGYEYWLALNVHVGFFIVGVHFYEWLIVFSYSPAWRLLTATLLALPTCPASLPSPCSEGTYWLL